jgi:L-lactate transport
MPFTQVYDPLHNVLLSTLLAALPVLTLFLLLVVARVLAPWAAAGGAAMALVIATAIYHMPVPMAAVSFVYGALFGLFPICWTIVNAMLLYNITVETGKFESIKNSIAGLSADHRLQAVLIGFGFGAFLEGAAGGGTPVAICAAMMVGLGFDAFLAACLCLIANTSPVAYGGFGTPLLTLGKAMGLDDASIPLLSKMAGNQLPLLSCLVPLWLVRCMCGWKETLEVMPAIAVAGGSFAVSQFFFAHSAQWQLTDIAGGVISLAVTAVFLNYWRPKRIWRFETHRAEKAPEDAVTFVPVEKMKLGRVASAWMPYIILCVLMVIVGSVNAAPKKTIDKTWGAGPLRAAYDIPMPNLHVQVQRTPPVVEPGAKPEPAVFTFNWLSMPGTSVLVAALIAMVMLRMTKEQVGRVVRTTVHQMAIPVPTIVCMLGLAYVTRYSGIDATLGLAFQRTGPLFYPFFAAILGWLGVFLTGTDAGSNALFGSLQKITATGLGLSPILICVANSTGGVMGKMIDAQSICVATAATKKVGTEADIFKFVVWHSVILASIVGLIVMLQAHVYPFTLMVPAMPGAGP